MVMRVLNVAEKPSVAKSLSDILSGGAYRTEQGENKYCKNFYFEYGMKSQTAEMVFTSVLGHLSALEFKTKSRWDEVEPKQLFDEPVNVYIPEEMKDVSRNILNVGSRCSMLVIWTDCDREGEHIGHEISTLLKGRVRETKRARFSGLSAYEIKRAIENLCEINMKEAQAVSARIELNLRIGAALTRIQTLRLRDVVAEKRVVSYGSCQIPTLGFVCEGEEAREQFVEESKWTIEAAAAGEGGGGGDRKVDSDGDISSAKEISNSRTSRTTKDILRLPVQQKAQEKAQQTTDKTHSAVFKWSRGYIYDQRYVDIKYAQIQGHPLVVTKSEKKPVQKHKPYPLRTVELQKFFTRKGGDVSSSHELMKIAEGLYIKGYISYPRTETDAFPDNFNYTEPLNNLKTDRVLSEYTRSLVPEKPSKGKHNDQAHTPIYPMRDGSALQGKDRAVYEYIARRYLACYSKHAEGVKEHTEGRIGTEMFTRKTLRVVKKNYLEVFIYEKWGDSEQALDARVGDVIPCRTSQKEAQTEKPSLLTEAELISKMDANEIGTDATIHDHIQKIKEREYVRTVNKNQLKSTWLGKGLIEGYKRVGLTVSEPELRKNFEKSLKSVCNGLTAPETVMKHEIDTYKEIYRVLDMSFSEFKEEIVKEMGRESPQEDSDGGSDADNNEMGMGMRAETSRSMEIDRSREGEAQKRVSTKKHKGMQNEKYAKKNSSDDVYRKDANSKYSNTASSGMSRYSSAAQTSAHATDRYTAANKRSSRNIDNSFVENLPPGTVVCNCNVQAKKQVVKKEGKNKGKLFYACAMQQCDYFQWTDKEDESRRVAHIKPEPAVQPRRDTKNEVVDDVKCLCGMASKLLKSKTDKNKDREFYTCNKAYKKCTFFAWKEDVMR